MQQVDLCDKQQCTGCSACANVCAKNAITMCDDSEGFLIPVINNNLCISCGLCQKVCPIINKRMIKETQPISIFAGYIKDTRIRRISASGGAFPAFANFYYSLPNGMVAAASFDNHLNLKHVLSTSKKDLHKLQGSKYLQSEIGFIYQDILNNLKQEKEICFVGTPCQVAGLKSFLRRDYDNLFTIDLVCHGVPSPKLFHEYLKKIGISDRNNYSNFFFRSRNNSAFFHHSVLKNYIMSKSIPPSKHSYICAYLKGWLHRESCYHCPFASIPRQGDCTIADFWGIISGKVPFNGDFSQGISMIMVNNEKGMRAFRNVQPALYVEEKTLNEAKIDNHNLYAHDIRTEHRDLVYKELLDMTPEDFMEKYDLKLPLPVSLTQRIRNRIKRIIGFLWGQM